MSAQDNQTVEHSMMAAAPATTLQTQINAGGKMADGVPSPCALPINTWAERIGYEYCIDQIKWAAADPTGTVIKDRDVNPFDLRTFENYRCPWFPWYLTFYMQYTCSFDLELEFITHSAHRGSVAVHLTGSRLSDDHKTSLMAPTTICDISGGQKIFVIPIPDMYSSTVKLVNPYQKIEKVADGDAIVPHYLDVYLAHLTVTVQTPFVASSLLPSDCLILIKLRPNLSTLRLFNPVRPMQTDARWSSPRIRYTT